MYWVIRVQIFWSFQPRQRVSWVPWFFGACKHWWYRGTKWRYGGWLFGCPLYHGFMNLATLIFLHINDLVFGELEVWNYVKKPLKLSFWDIILRKQNTFVQIPDPPALHAHWFRVYILSQTFNLCLHPILHSLQTSDHWFSWWRYDVIFGFQTSDLVQL